MPTDIFKINFFALPHFKVFKYNFSFQNNNL